ncbi:hypothetical protein A2291_00920 [candidate division WOR-1 bacterium RIFOXYB2_FULL_42_35]|uniref:Uncharacterized protein TP-0789 domain-containing protein n=1 Tax=candidate division WOR-1 bacterium RIFOXYC2_FULL_41_25 TaxID=1802586 RepID=A0A1F4TLH9_UNCSA|nr:MAG: hypothetical protein A2247_05905 [candidate division WOR-1 bacterium RIFOXYA2_FULL_41_14]OGC23617.1 MAG: hypothetical protein A2291_00920 [candidate division WOR-1 bacterium RIFOXYB2_FULL_42_35]OGC33581.1 MAG: hypothetical protein A2462_02735 [candidate division WOR-1 bacterium RIFOXYC2_FULL_41_25]OGC41747.1 MAG: hypothetical protein A2548_03290 [candidate division WOR-1 bacterium RIFOXYD2_FULL_41_8]
MGDFDVAKVGCSTDFSTISGAAVSPDTQRTIISAIENNFNLGKYSADLYIGFNKDGRNKSWTARLVSLQGGKDDFRCAKFGTKLKDNRQSRREAGVVITKRDQAFSKKDPNQPSFSALPGVNTGIFDTDYSPQDMLDSLNLLANYDVEKFTSFTSQGNKYYHIMLKKKANGEGFYRRREMIVDANKNVPVQIRLYTKNTRKPYKVMAVKSKPFAKRAFPYSYDITACWRTSTTNITLGDLKEEASTTEANYCKGS